MFSRLALAISLLSAFSALSLQAEEPSCGCKTLCMIESHLQDKPVLSRQPGLETPSLQLKQNDRVVFVGNTFLERENEFGEIEFAIRLAHAKLDLSFRNLSWSGDNVFGESRAYFGSVEDGYQHRLRYVRQAKPNLVFLCYGQNAAFQGKPQLQQFRKGYQRLIDDLKKITNNIVLLSPVPQEKLPAPFPDPKIQNQRLAEYVKAIANLAKTNQLGYIDLFRQLPVLTQQFDVERYTTNSLHLNRDGYALCAEIILRYLQKSIVQNGELPTLTPAWREQRLPVQRAIHKKNELFFHRFRPQNETYLRGFRKQEQGQNAKEIYEFDKLVDTEEQRIRQLVRQITSHTKP